MCLCCFCSGYLVVVGVGRWGVEREGGCWWVYCSLPQDGFCDVSNQIFTVHLSRLCF